MERAHPRENSHLGFEASHLLQLSTNQFFCVNGKQPESNQICRQV